MPEADANMMLAAVVVLVPLVGGCILVWQRATADLKASARWRGKVETQLEHLDKLPDRVSELETCQHRIQNDVAWIRGRLERKET